MNWKMLTAIIHVLTIRGCWWEVKSGARVTIAPSFHSRALSLSKLWVNRVVNINNHHFLDIEYTRHAITNPKKAVDWSFTISKPHDGTDSLVHRRPAG